MTILALSSTRTSVFFLTLATLLVVTPLTRPDEIKGSTSKDGITVRIRWASCTMKSGVLIEEGDLGGLRLPGQLESRDPYCILFVGTIVENDTNQVVRVKLEDFRAMAGGDSLAATAYCLDTPVFVATSGNRQFAVEPGHEIELGVAFLGLRKASETVEFGLLDLPPITFPTPPVD